MEGNRLTKVRRNYDDDSQKFEGMMIGNQLDDEGLRKQKNLAQKAYQQQLEDDKYLRPIETERRNNSARRKSFNNNQSDYIEGEGNFLHIGSFDAYQKENQRKIAMEISLKNREEAYAKMLEKSSSTRRRGEMNCRDADQRIFEDSQNLFAIGSDDKDSKETKRIIAMEILAKNRENAYLKLMSATEEDSPQKYRLAVRKVSDRETEQRLFEDSPQQFNIGFSEEKLREDKRRAARELIERSKEDIYYREASNAESLENPNRRNKVIIDKELDQRFEDAEYKGIGGPAGDRMEKHSKIMYGNNNGNFVEFSYLIGMNNNSEDKYNRNIVEDKYAKQAEYRRLLDQQRMKSKEITRLESTKYGY